MHKSLRISLANKCQLLFGAAVVLILSAALTVGAVRMQTLVREGQEETARKLANAWLAGMIHIDDEPPNAPDITKNNPYLPGFKMTAIEKADFIAKAGQDSFLSQAIATFRTQSNRTEIAQPAHDTDGQKLFRYARAVRASDLALMHDNNPDKATSPSSPDNPLEKVLMIDVQTFLAQNQLILNRVYIIAAGLLAGLLAIGAFWFITTRIILSPVRVLRETAAKVSKGDLNIRSDINTGDEFEQMSDMFNTMLENLKTNQDQLRSVNKSLDLKLGELAEHNVSLHEANVVKGQFLANVSHELRTPLNSIIGFAEILGEAIGKNDDPATEKHRRYINNIVTSSRRLLELINDLLDLAKIEAGRIELRVAAMSVADTAEGLINLIRPQSEKRGIQLELDIQRDIPVVHTDAGKFQQIMFNFLSNAIKFTPAGGTITLTAKLLADPAGTAPTGDEDPPPPMLCMSVTDTGPGIPIDQHDQIFEKFTQLDSTATREHGGTGLGLTISLELAGLLQGRIDLDSDTGQGATFSLIIPQVLQQNSAPLMPNLAATHQQIAKPAEI
jgi:signal transduction histidine kinase